MGVDSVIVQAVFGDSAVLRLADLAAGWLLTYLLHSTVIILGVWGLASRRRLSDAARDTAWKLALVGGIITASVQTVAAPSPFSTTLQLPARATARPARTLTLPPSGAVPAGEGRFVMVRSRGTRWTAALLMVWAAASGVALLWLTRAHGRTLRDIGERDPLDDSPAGARLRALRERAGIARDVRLTCSEHLTSPVALSGDEICVPRRALVELNVAEQEGMLAHELAHVVRRDPQWLVAARVIEALLFMQPLNRLARRRLQEVAEYLCDDWAIRRAAHPVSLARCLAAVAEWVSHPRGAPVLTPLSAMVEQGASPLVRRVGRILGDRGRSRDRRLAPMLAASFGALVALVAVMPRVSIAGATPRGKSMMVVRGAVNHPDLHADPASRPVADSVRFVVMEDSVLLEGGGAVWKTRAAAGRGRLIRRTNVLVRTISLPADSAAAESIRARVRR